MSRATCCAGCEESLFGETQSFLLSHARKITCAEMRRMRGFGVVFTRVIPKVEPFLSAFIH